MSEQVHETDAVTPPRHTCDQCGAPTADCVQRFHVLLALDHSRTEPWGSRHGLAFAVFTLQHSRGASAESLERCLEMLHRVYVLGDDRMRVVSDFRRRGASNDVDPSRLGGDEHRPKGFTFTIYDMGDFGAESYAANLDTWCRATLAAWSR